MNINNIINKLDEEYVQNLGRKITYHKRIQEPVIENLNPITHNLNEPIIENGGTEPQYHPPIKLKAFYKIPYVYHKLTTTIEFQLPYNKTINKLKTQPKIGDKIIDHNNTQWIIQEVTYKNNIWHGTSRFILKTKIG